MKKIGFLLVLSLFLVGCNVDMTFVLKPTPTPTATVTPTATATATAIPTRLPFTPAPPTVTPTRSANAPVLKGVNVRYDRSTSELSALGDVWFSDADGDVTTAHTFIVFATTRNMTTLDVPITIPAPIQIQGVTIILRWGCGTERYDVTLRMILLDKQGNQSNGIEYTIHCRDNA